MEFHKVNMITFTVFLQCCISTAFVKANAVDSMNVFVTISNGETLISQESVTVSDVDGDGALSLHDALFCAHEQYYEGGAAKGYEMQETEWGKSLLKVCGIENGCSYGYFVNHESADNLDFKLTENCYVDVFAYTDLDTFSDTYSYFDNRSVECSEDGSVTLSLYTKSYDENFNLVENVLADARILLNGEASSYRTDSNGKVTLIPDNSSDCVVSAVCDELLLVPPIAVIHSTDNNITNSDRPNISALISEMEQSRLGGDIQSFLDSSLVENVGNSSADTYILSFLHLHPECDFHFYRDAISCEIPKMKSQAAQSRQRAALTWTALGSDADFSLAADVLADTYGKQGIMSFVYALHLQNNGVPYSDASALKTAQVLASMQCADGGWSLTGKSGDVDITAMTLQALAPFMGQDDAVTQSINNGFTYLSSCQLENGGFENYQQENVESAAQVWMALSCLKIDGLTDERFLKNGHSLLDAILAFQTETHTFQHIIGGGENDAATVQVYASLCAYQHFLHGGESFYIFDNALDFSSDSVTSTSQPAEIASQDSNIIFCLILTALIVILSAGFSICILRRKSGKAWQYVCIMISSFAALCAVWIFLYTPEQEFPNRIGTVNVTISCDDILGKEGAEQFPSDGKILEKTSVSLCASDTAYDVLMRVVQQKKLQIDVSGVLISSEQAVYVRAIDNLYEFQFGDTAGWLYQVNGANPTVGAGEYLLSDGDDILWYYSCTLDDD